MAKLSLPPEPLLFESLYEPGLRQDLSTVLPYLLRIDAAHLLMLERSGLLSRSAAAQLLAVHHEMDTRVRRGDEPFSIQPPHRGLYWLYEQHYIQRLGSEIGGAVHLARSRNDINATVARMRARDQLLELLDALTALLEEMIARAADHAAALMSCFTHLQPAQPSTLGHYRAGVGAELARTGEWLASIFDSIDRSPMGAAAGSGTSFAIDQDLVARYLGFSRVMDNAADAVASRDYLIQILSAAAAAGVTITRLAHDLQHWASYAYGFLSWPDGLVSSSSMMPQKRNAFVLESVRGHAVRPAAALFNSLMAMKSAPFSNSVEVSAEATAPAWPAFDSLRTAMRLMALLLQRLEVDHHRMRAFLDGAHTTMTALANHLVAKHGLAFRTAHDAVGALVRELPEREASDATAIGARLEAILAKTIERPVQLNPSEVAAALDPDRCLASARHGGGPAPVAVRRQLSGLTEACARLREQAAAWRRRLAEAGRMLAEEAEAIRNLPPQP